MWRWVPRWRGVLAVVAQWRSTFLVGRRSAARSPSRAAGAAPAGDLHVGVPRLPATLDPADARTVQPIAMRLLYQGLRCIRRRAATSSRLSPTAWTVSRDGLVWAFRLPPGRRSFHDGAPARSGRGGRILAERISTPTSRRTARPPGSARFAAAARIVREVQTRRGEPRSRSCSRQPYAPPPRAPGAPGPRDRRAAARRAAGREQAVPGRSSSPAGPAHARGSGDLARGPAPERPPHPARGRRRRGRARRAGARRPLHAAQLVVRPRRGRRWASRSSPARRGESDFWRFAPIAASPARRRCARPSRSALDPALLNPALGQWAVPHAAWLPPGRVGGARRRPARSSMPRDARRLLAQVAPIGSDDDAPRVGAGRPVRRPPASPTRSGSRWAPPGFRGPRSAGGAGRRPTAAARQGAAELTLHEETLEA